MTRLRLGTRGSELATTQSRHVARLLESRLAGIEVELVIIRTEGDRLQSEAPLPGVKLDKGLFTTALEDALRARTIDLAVHSLKDLPTTMPSGLVVAAIPEREDPRDALLSGGQRLGELPAGARIGTSSERRRRQLLALRRDLEILPIRGNVDTRIRKLRSGEFDALVLAAAGLVRLGRGGEIVEHFALDDVLPAPGQGALAIETRDDETATLIGSALDDAAVRAAVTAERAVLEAIGGGCQLPLGAFARVAGDRLELRAALYPEAFEVRRAAASGPCDAAQRLGAAVAKTLLATGSPS
jgi:hydroxymethylbilane synthase